MKVKSLELISDFCPAQWTGWTEGGFWIYCRYRYGVLRIEVWEKKDFEGQKIKEYIFKIGDSFDGSFKNLEKVKKTIIKILDGKIDLSKAQVKLKKLVR